MKKRYRTVFDASALSFPTIMVSGGRIGTQVEAAPDDLLRVTGASTADLTEPAGI